MTTPQMLQNKPGVIGATIITKSGRYFDFLDPQPDMIEITDIAHAYQEFMNRFQSLLIGREIIP